MIIFLKKNMAIIILIIYTWLNMRFLYPFLFGEEGNLLGVAFQTNGSNLLALFVGLFLNVALILYWLKNN